MHLPNQWLHTVCLGLFLAKTAHQQAAAVEATTCLNLQLFTVIFQDPSVI